MRALYTSATSTTRIAATWFNTTSFLIDLAFNDGKQHQLALYCLDWDTTQRAETVAIQDANGVLLNTQNMTNFHNGDYLVWELSGHVHIVVTTTTTTANAVVSGLFFDPVVSTASSFAFTGPTGGALNTASSNFTSDAKWHLRRHDYHHSVGRWVVHAGSADVRLCCIADVHHRTDSSGAGYADTEQQRDADQSGGSEVCDTAGSTDDRDSDGWQWANHGIVHGSGEHGWVSNHEL